MKKILFFSCALLFTISSSSFADSNFSVPSNDENPGLIDPNIPGLENISQEELFSMKPRQLEEKLGRKLKFREKVAFKVSKFYGKKQLKRQAKGKKTKAFKFHAGGFFLGFFLGLIGVLIAYLAFDDRDKGPGKSSLIGLGAFLVLWIILVAAVFSSATTTI